MKGKLLYGNLELHWGEGGGYFIVGKSLPYFSILTYSVIKTSNATKYLRSVDEKFEMVTIRIFYVEKLQLGVLNILIVYMNIY